MTGGLENGVASLVGRSLQDTDSPTIGFCAHASVQGKEHLVGGQSGVVHYHGAEALSSSPKCRRPLPSSAARDEAAAAPLCRLHSHFLLVDSGTADGQSGERLLRRQVERYLCEHDISGDGVKTPMVLLVINGDVESLLSVIEALETPTSSESSSGSARPVLVMADSGGAAEDIFNYSERQQLPDPERRSKEYCTQAALLLPRIVELGKVAGPNETLPLSFFSLREGEDVGHDHLALLLQRALQNDCSDRERVLLAVAWGEPLILRDLLEKQDGERLLSLALETALLRRDVPVTRMLMDFEASPTFTRIQRLFASTFNRYRVSEGHWSTGEEGREEFLSDANPDITAASNVLSEQVHGYKTHFAARRQQALEGRVFALSPTWTDLMMWALLIGGERPIEPCPIEPGAHPVVGLYLMTSLASQSQTWRSFSGQRRWNRSGVQ